MKQILLNNGQYTFVDDLDYEVVNLYHPWYFKEGYAAHTLNKQRSTLFMHELILPPKEGFQTDHINRNKLDNRRENLRYATPSQNRMNRVIQPNNTSGYKGVSFNIANGKYRAYIGKPQKHLGFFKTAEEAALAYNKKAKKLYGAFAFINVIPSTAPAV